MLSWRRVEVKRCAVVLSLVECAEVGIANPWAESSPCAGIAKQIFICSPRLEAVAAGAIQQLNCTRANGVLDRPTTHCLRPAYDSTYDPTYFS